MLYREINTENTNPVLLRPVQKGPGEETEFARHPPWCELERAHTPSTEILHLAEALADSLTCRSPKAVLQRKDPKCPWKGGVATKPDSRQQTPNTRHPDFASITLSGLGLSEWSSTTHIQRWKCHRKKCSNRLKNSEKIYTAIQYCPNEEVW